MQETDILQALDKWNIWNRELDSGIERPEYLQQIERLAATGQILSVTGARRAGKSYLLRQYLKKIAEKNGPRTTLYINFEEPFFSNAHLDDLSRIYATYRQHINPSTKPFVFLDEIQKVHGWEKFARSLHERQEATLFVSGSTSALISREYGSLLTGRHLDATIYPLGFYEFLHFHGLKIRNEIDLLSKKEKVNHLLIEYLRWGSFPHVVLSEEKEPLLATYFNDILYRDIVERYAVRESALLQQLAVYYLSNIAAPHTHNRLKKFIPLSHDSIGRFSAYMEEAYLIFSVKKYARSLKEQQTNPRKIYGIDTGLSNVVGFREKEGLGRLLENLVFLELKRRGKDIYYWKNRYGHEIDFVVRERNIVREIIQVCYDPESSKDREERAITAWCREYGKIKSTVVTASYEKEGDPEYCPFYRWSLKPYLQTQR